MAEGEGVADQGIRVRLDESASRIDVSALKEWLERETLQENVRVIERPRGDVPDGHMGVGMELWLVVAGSGTTVVVDRLLDQIIRAVRAWRDNRREVESGEPPRVRVEPVDLDER
ncbi:hypothetical protein [Streptomyces griseus]|uniref:effector-associated constant component EACC1 n=1 Tax=Streptomyces griseus TaxID=1911 RepID=UPI0005661B83|nr:hypothetical protein [Streptomyces griseus]